MLTFPKKFEFISCNSIVELVEEVMPDKRVKAVKPKSARYKYIYVASSTSKKLGTQVEYELDYLTRLEGFDLIKLL